MPGAAGEGGSWRLNWFDCLIWKNALVKFPCLEYIHDEFLDDDVSVKF
jgi:hypothetical protein